MNAPKLVIGRAGCAALLLLAVAIAIAIALGILAFHTRKPRPTGPRWDQPSPDAVWPWPGVVPETITSGVTHWRRTTADNTDVELVRFDFVANPRLRFEMYDQDQDATPPWTDHVAYNDVGVAQAAAHLDAIGRGKVIAATNGLFFNSDDGIHASHISPVVVDGVPHYAGGDNYRWTFGVKYIGGRPRFAAYHTPGRAILASQFDYAAGAAQVLIWDGVAAASPAEERGDDDFVFETMRTSRVAYGWSKDNRYLYLLYVREPDAEGSSGTAARMRVYQGGGWMESDERRFFEALGVWRAFNSDGGQPAQLLLARPDDRYDLVTPENAAPETRMILPADAKSAPDVAAAPHGGTLLYWYVREGSWPSGAGVTHE